MCRNLASEKAELAEAVQRLEGKLAVATAEGRQAAKEKAAKDKGKDIFSTYYSLSSSSFPLFSF